MVFNWFLSSNTRSKKRKRNENQWLRNVRKDKYQKGLKHVNSVGRLVNEKQLKPICGQNCRYKCSTKVSLSERMKQSCKVFIKFLTLGVLE